VTTPNHTTREQQLRDNFINGQGSTEHETAQLQALATARLADAQERIAAALEVANRIPRR
jgi:hypothetical protein